MYIVLYTYIFRNKFLIYLRREILRLIVRNAVKKNAKNSTLNVNLLKKTIITLRNYVYQIIVRSFTLSD